MVPAGVTAARYVHVVGADVWVDDEPADPAWRRTSSACSTASPGGRVDVPTRLDPSDGAAVDLRAFSRTAPASTHWLAAGRAVQLVEWGRTHRFCGRCGAPTEPVGGERAMRCPACGLVAFPRLAPAMITLVTRGDDGPDQEALLARGAQWPVPMYSCLAGFVEPGESLEGAVAGRSRRRSGSWSATSATAAASRGPSRTA